MTSPPEGGTPNLKAGTSAKIVTNVVLTGVSLKYSHLLVKNRATFRDWTDIVDARWRESMDTTAGMADARQWA
jgi:hypothetical protein